jgi:hypothetical protein
VRSIERSDGSFRRFLLDHGLRYFGLHRTSSGWVFREWAPCACSASLVGDFNGWDVKAHPCELNHLGVWEAHVAEHAGGGERRLGPGFKYKVALRYLGGGDAAAAAGVGGGVGARAQGSGGHDSFIAKAGGGGVSPQHAPAGAPACFGAGARGTARATNGAGGAPEGGSHPPAPSATGAHAQAPPFCEAPCDGWVFAVPAWAQQCRQDATSHTVSAVVPSSPLEVYSWKHTRPPRPASLRVYEVRRGELRGDVWTCG